MIAATLKQQQQPSGAVSARSHQNRSGRRGSGSVAARAADGGPPRFDRSAREERRQSGSMKQPLQQQLHRGGGGSAAEPINTEQKSESLATPPGNVDGGFSAARAENGRESRSTISETSGSGRRQPQPPHRQQFTTRYR